MEKTITLAVLMLFAGMAYSSSEGKPESATILHLNDDDVLFIGDSKSGTIYAYETNEVNGQPAENYFNIKAIDKKIASYLGTTVDNIIIRDLAVNSSSLAFISVDRISDSEYVPAVIICDQEGKLRTFDLNSPHTQITVTDNPTSEYSYWDKYDLKQFTFTDINFQDGKLYVSGLSNADFASILRVFSYPFDNKYTSTSIEIYHAVHNQKETRAPIRSFEIMKLNGEDFIVAAYTCTPLVTIPLSALEDGKHVVGKTIAELGFGNTPIDFVATKKGLLLSNKNRNAMFLSNKDLSEYNKNDGIAKWAGFSTKGVPYSTFPLTGVLHLAGQNSSTLLSLRRDWETNSLDLLSFMGKVGFRFSDFDAEYSFPDYKYKGFMQKMYSIFHKKMKRNEGIFEE